MGKNYMKKARLLVSAILCLNFCLLLLACGTDKDKDSSKKSKDNASVSVDFENETDFETALNNGDNLTGKTVSITVRDRNPDSAFGYNLIAGEHLNFCSTDNPDVEVGEEITVKVKEVKSVLGSWIIYYKKLD